MCSPLIIGLLINVFNLETVLLDLAAVDETDHVISPSARLINVFAVDKTYQCNCV